jgi:hypothetical protein
MKRSFIRRALRSAVFKIPPYGAPKIPVHNRDAWCGRGHHSASTPGALASSDDLEKVEHVLLISVDGIHQSDLAWYFQPTLTPH